MRNFFIGSLVAAILSGCSHPSGHSTRPDDAVIRGVNYVGLSVSDLAAVSDLYQQALDLHVVEDNELMGETVFDALAGRDDVRAATRLLKSSNGQLRLMQFAAASEKAKKALPVEVYGPGIAHVGFQSKSETQAYQRFLQAGAEYIGDRDMVKLNTKSPVSYSYSKDMDGRVVEIEHVDMTELDVVVKHDHRLRHVSLATSDIDRAVDFYSELLQEYDPRRLGRWMAISGDKLDQVSGEDGSELEFAFFQVRNMELEIIQYLSHDVKHQDTPRPIDALGYNLIMFDVDDLATARTMLIKAGGKLVIDIQAFEGSEVFFGRDPDGNLLGFQRTTDTSVYSSQNFLTNGT